VWRRAASPHRPLLQTQRRSRLPCDPRSTPLSAPVSPPTDRSPPAHAPNTSSPCGCSGCRQHHDCTSLPLGSQPTPCEREKTTAECPLASRVVWSPLSERCTHLGTMMLVAQGTLCGQQLAVLVRMLFQQRGGGLKPLHELVLGRRLHVCHQPLSRALARLHPQHRTALRVVRVIPVAAGSECTTGSCAQSTRTRVCAWEHVRCVCVSITGGALRLQKRNQRIAPGGRRCTGAPPRPPPPPPAAPAACRSNCCAALSRP
jgi:hypothetical protein